MRIGIPKEKNKNETRVAIVPVSIPKLMKLGFDVIIEKGEALIRHYLWPSLSDKPIIGL